MLVVDWEGFETRLCVWFLLLTSWQVQCKVWGCSGKNIWPALWGLCSVSIYTPLTAWQPRTCHNLRCLLTCKMRRLDSVIWKVCFSFKVSGLYATSCICVPVSSFIQGDRNLSHGILGRNGQPQVKITYVSTHSSVAEWLCNPWKTPSFVSDSVGIFVKLCCGNLSIDMFSWELRSWKCFENLQGTI